MCDTYKLSHFSSNQRVYNKKTNSQQDALNTEAIFFFAFTYISCHLHKLLADFAVEAQFTKFLTTFSRGLNNCNQSIRIKSMFCVVICELNHLVLSLWKSDRRLGRLFSRVQLSIKVQKLLAGTKLFCQGCHELFLVQRHFHVRHWEGGATLTVLIGRGEWSFKLGRKFASSRCFSVHRTDVRG